MSALRQFIGRIRLQLQGNNQVVGWSMTPDEAIAFFKRQGKTVLTFFGYSAIYEDEAGLLKIAREVLSQHTPQSTLVNIGATRGGVGAVYPLARSMGFHTTGIVSTQALDYPGEISPTVDQVCFIEDTQWGGKLPGSEELSPTSKAMVACSDLLVAIGGNDIARDELLAGRAKSKPIQFFPAEVNHAWLIGRAKRLELPAPESFRGAVHEVFGK